MAISSSQARRHNGLTRFPCSCPVICILPGWGCNTNNCCAPNDSALPAMPFYRHKGLHLRRQSRSYQLSALEVISKFEDLEVWKRSSRLCADLYKHFELSALRADLKDEHRTSNVQHRILNKVFCQFINRQSEAISSFDVQRWTFDLPAMPLGGLSRMSSCVGLVIMIIRPSFVVHGRRVFDVQKKSLIFYHAEFIKHKMAIPILSSYLFTERPQPPIIFHIPQTPISFPPYSAASTNILSSHTTSDRWSKIIKCPSSAPHLSM